MKSVSVEEFCRFSCLSHMRFSPEGDKACFAVAKADMEKNAYTSEIWKLEGKKCSQLTAGGREKSFVFLDNDTVPIPLS